MNRDHVLSLLGIAKRGRNLVSGEFSVETAVKKGRAFVAIVAEDASDNTKKNFSDMCDFYHVPLYFYRDKDTLGHAIGCEMRASVAVLDEGLAKAVIKDLEEVKANGGI